MQEGARAAGAREKGHTGLQVGSGRPHGHLRGVLCQLHRSAVLACSERAELAASWCIPLRSKTQANLRGFLMKLEFHPEVRVSKFFVDACGGRAGRGGELGCGAAPRACRGRRPSCGRARTSSPSDRRRRSHAPTPACAARLRWSRRCRSRPRCAKSRPPWRGSRTRARRTAARWTAWGRGSGWTSRSVKKCR